MEHREHPAKSLLIWLQVFNFKAWADNYDLIFPTFTKGYASNLGPEHAIERVIPTMVHAYKQKIAEISPAPKIFAMYFPQFHRVLENDEFWLSKVTYNMNNHFEIISVGFRNIILACTQP